MSTPFVRRRWATIIAAVLATAGAVPLAAVATEGQTVVFRVGVTQSARLVELNPFRTFSGQGYLLIADRYDLLIGFGGEFEPVPGLAESWETSEDGLTWTYHIRPGATWQDGQPVSAEDAAFTLNYIIDSHRPDYIGPAAPDGNDTDGDGSADNQLSAFDNYIDLDAGIENMRLNTVEAIDANTLVITTSVPIVTLAQMYIPILPKHIWEQKTFVEASGRIEIADAIGSGPFQIVEFEPAQLMRLVAHETYWGGRPHIDELIYQVFENDEAQVNALKDGSVDLLDNFPPTLIGALESDPNITINSGPGIDFNELGFNSWAPTPERFETEGCADCPRGPTTGSLGDPWITRPDVRAALAGLLDKQHLIEFALGGYGAPGYSIVSPLVSFYQYVPPPDDPVTFPAYQDEAGRAAARAAAEQRFRDAMAAIGFSDTDGNGTLNVPNTPAAMAFDPLGAGQDWSLRLFVRADDEEEKLAGQLIQQWFDFGAGGVDVLYEERSEDNFYEFTYPSVTNADMDMYLWGFGGDPDPDFIMSIFACNQINGWQDANYCNPEYDELYRATRTAANLEERAELVKQVQDIAYHESPYAVTWYQDTLEAYRSDRWEGLFAIPREGGALWNAYGVGPWGSRTSVGPIGAAGSDPLVAPSPGPNPSAEPTPSGQPAPSGQPTPTGAGASATPPTGVVPSPGAPSVAPSGQPAGTPRPSATPAPGQGGTGGGDSTPLLLGVGAIAVLAAAGLLWWRRRNSYEDDDDDE